MPEPDTRSTGPAEASDQRITPRLWGVHTWASLGLAIGILVVLAMQIDLEAVWAEIRACDETLVALATVIHYAAYYVRGLRWKRSLSHLHSGASASKFGLLILFYQFIDNLVPGKLAELYAAHLVRINVGVSRSAALGSLVFLRVIDAWIVLGFAATSAWSVFADRLPDGVAWVLAFGLAMAALLTLAVIAALTFKRIRSARLPEVVHRSFALFRAGVWPHRGELLTICGLSLIAWGLEVLWLLLLVRSFGLEPGLLGVVMLTTLPALASAFPLTPAGTGAVELTLYGCLRALDVSSSTAAAVTALNRIIDYWLHNAIGVIVWALRHRLGMRAWREPAGASPGGR